jgi:hypothetical protein
MRRFARKRGALKKNIFIKYNNTHFTMPRKTKSYAQSRSKHYRAKSRRCRRGGAPTPIEVENAIEALKKLDLFCNKEAIQPLVETIKNGLYMDALDLEYQYWLRRKIGY